MSTTQRQSYREMRVHKMEGKPPSGLSSWQAFAEQIPVYESVDKALLYQNDPSPFHIVLDIAVLNAVSANGLLYDEPLISAMETQLLGLGGLRGHLGQLDYSAYPIEAVDWIGHVRVGDTVYAKGYLAPGEQREAVRRTIARGGKLRTSLDAQGYQEWVDKKKGVYRLREVEFFSIDLVHSGKAALKNYQSGDAYITRETESQENHMLNAEQELPNGTPPAPTVHLAVEGQSATVLREEINGMKLERDAALKKAEEAEKQTQEARRYASVVGSIRVNLGYGDDVSDDALVPKITEMYNQLQRLAEMLGNDASIEVAVAELLSSRETAQKLEAEQRLDAAVRFYTEAWNVQTEAGKAKVTALHKQFRRAILAETKEGETPDVVAARVWDEEFKDVAESILASIGGPGAVISAKTNDKESSTKPSKEEIDAMASRFVRPSK
jgi:hypothetical protein